MALFKMYLKGYTTSKCTVPGCERLCAPDHRNGLCKWHILNTILQGAPRAVSIATTQRKPYTAAALALLHKKLKARDPVLFATLEELRVFLKCQCERLPLTGWPSYKPVRKAHAMLWNIQRRYEEHAALVIMATIAGVMFCVKHEPGVLKENITYTSFQIMRALSSLMMSDGQQMVLPRKGGPGVWRPYKPKPSGRLLVGHLERLVIQPARRLLTDLGPQFEADLLRRILTHSPARAIRLPQPSTKKESQP